MGDAVKKREIEDSLSRIGCYSLVEEDGKIWFPSLMTNGLYEYDKTKCELRRLMTFSIRTIYDAYMYYDIEKVGDVLVLAAWLVSPCIVFFDLSNGESECIELEPFEHGKMSRYHNDIIFRIGCSRGDFVWFMGDEYPAIVKVDVPKRSVKYITGWLEGFEQREPDVEGRTAYFTDCTIVENQIYVLCENIHAILCLDMEDDWTKFIDIDSDIEHQCGLYYDGNFWISGYSTDKNVLRKYDAKFRLVDEIMICETGPYEAEFLKAKIWKDYPIIDMEDKLLLFSVYPSHVFEYEKATGRVSINQIFERLLDHEDPMHRVLKIHAPRKNGTMIEFITGKDFVWREYDYGNDALNSYELNDISVEELKNKTDLIFQRLINEDQWIWEARYDMTLSRYLEHMRYV